MYMYTHLFRYHKFSRTISISINGAFSQICTPVALVISFSTICTPRSNISLSYCTNYRHSNIKRKGSCKVLCKYAMLVFLHVWLYIAIFLLNLYIGLGVQIFSWL